MFLQGEILYVLSDNRSGSTLLDQLLGAHPDVVSVGELHWLSAYVRKDRTLYNPVHPLVCACGQAVMDCSFWASVQEAANRPLDSFRLKPRFFRWQGAGSEGNSFRERMARLPMRMIKRHPYFYKNPVGHKIVDGPTLARDSIALSNAILRASGRKIIVDSSKSALKFWSVYRQQPDNTKAVILVRDYRAVVYSKMKRGQSLEGAALGWRRKMEQIDFFTSGVADDRCHRLNFESLCADPTTELTALCAFLGIDFDNKMLSRPADNVHHIGGSPSKFDPGKRAISLDKRYEKAFDQDALNRMRDLVGDVADSWGY
jgi:hypothetical protein